MPDEKRTITYSLKWRDTGVKRGASDVSRAMGTTTGSFTKLAGAAGALGAAVGAIELGRKAFELTQLSVAADEAASKFATVFDGVEGATEALDRFRTTAGVATAAAQDLWGTAGNLAQNMGLSGEEALRLTAAIGQVSGDFASFHDQDPAAVFRDIQQAVFTTERDAMKKYGVTVSELEVRQRALMLATADGRKEVTRADRAMASYQIILSQAGDATGDLERTSDSLANRQRRLAARTADLQVALGRRLQPALEIGIDLLGDLADVAGLADSALDDLGELAEQAAATQEHLNRATTDTATFGLTALVRGLGAVARALQGTDEEIGFVNESLRNLEQRRADKLTLLTDRLRDNMRASADAAKELDEAAEAALGPFSTLAEKAQSIATLVGGLEHLERIAGFQTGTGTGGGVGAPDKLHQGGLVGGRPGEEQLIRALPGERVTRDGAMAGAQTVIILEVNVPELADPAATVGFLREMLEDMVRTQGPVIDSIGV